MTTAPSRAPGFAVFSSSSGHLARRRAERAADAVGDATTIAADEHTHVVLWGELRSHPLSEPIILGHGARTRGADVGRVQTRRLLAGEDDLRQVLPAFAAVDWDEPMSRLRIVVDWLGMRHVYLAEDGEMSGASTSAAVLARQPGTGAIDRDAIGVQSLLGWQLGDSTPFARVTKMGPGLRTCVSRGELSSSGLPPLRSLDPLSATDAPHVAADLLSDFVSGYLDDHPDSVLQLTGGLDSRLLLAAIPRSRRSSVETMTLAVPGSPDLEIAARLAADHRMRHHVVQMRGLGTVSDEDAWSLCAAAARDLDCAADPVALASLRWADTALPHRPRLAGLGGEVARGFYYFGPPLKVGVSRTLAATLAQWRLFPNDRVSPDALEPAFAAAATDLAVSEVHRALAAAGDDFWPATDEFYLWQRMQRWAGTLASATCFDRDVVNPMLDAAFLQIARALSPHDKRNMRFLSRILVDLDPALADIPMDNRPAPRTYARPTAANRARLGAVQSRKVIGKVRQRRSHTTRPPAGGEILAAKVVDHWRAHREILDPVRELDMFRPSWLDDVVMGRRSADPSSVALLVNLVVASGPVAAATAGSGSPRT
ncbi:asparagine synthase-related protein [Aeromicrobium wangtongii]|uniref:asparagine synthase-related protein n=1 Tax=Aeromicrobium wangtongii TaxID=2969247 RepID=UPI002017A531|nr:asparagine synthase-related protein [Aeromicrobium wangtongii]MCL3817854.1 asparagine synthase-related protein [Aeromicrobium wangtongii]